LSGEELGALVEEQAALRRVATLVARGVPPEEVFAAVTAEVGRLLGVEYAHLGRYGPDRTMTVVAGFGRAVHDFTPGRQWSLGGQDVATTVFETGHSARIDSFADASGPLSLAAREEGVGSGVGTPVIVEGRLWGVMATHSHLDRPLAADAETRLANFTDLVAAAIANAESRAGLARLAEEQAGLRRVATLVARGIPPDEVFAKVIEEVGRLLPVQFAIMGRFEADAMVTSVAVWGRPAARFPVGSRWALEGKNLVTMVLETGRPARVDRFGFASGPLGEAGREGGFHSAVGTPIVVEDRLWGIICVGATLQEPALPADTEARLVNFTELVATAIANAESGAAVAASRARIVTAADETRRRIERDLHDGVQQRLVSLMLELRRVVATEPDDGGELRAELARTARALGEVLDEVREISRGIHPAILSKGGLEQAVRALARRCALPVELDLHTERRSPEPVEVAAYHVVSEALTNAARHAHASVVRVKLEADDVTLRMAIRDDGIGGADPSRGSGLVELSDRIEALGGRLEVISPAGSGTTLVVEVPVAA
jgi:signal transduction histidine kinase